MEKLTNREMLNLIKEELSANEMVVAWCDHQIELLDNKKNANSAKVKEAQEKNAAITEIVVEALKEANEPMTITEILALPKVAEIKVEDKPLTNQKLTYLLNSSTKVTRQVVKKKAYFTVC